MVFGLARSPLAVRLVMAYHEALPLWEAMLGVVANKLAIVAVNKTALMKVDRAVKWGEDMVLAFRLNNASAH